MASKIILMIALSLYIMDLVILVVANVKFAQNMKMGGKVVVVLNILAEVFGAALVISCGIMVFKVFSGYEYDIFSIIMALAGSLIFFTLLMFRKVQNIGLNIVASKGEALRLSRETILYNLSHEVRTPLNSIMGLAEVIDRREKLSKQSEEDLDNIRDAGNSLLSIVNNIFDYGQIEANTFSLNVQPYETKNLIQSIIAASKNMLRNSNVEFLSDIDTNLPIKLKGDQEHIKQLVHNIMSNSCKYTHVGIITFRMRLNRKENESTIVFDIEDTGVGIKEDEQKELLSLSKNKSGEDSNKGVGLGLIVTKKLVDLMDGTITFSSEEGAGTTFTIEIVQQIVDATPIGQIEDLSNKKKNNNYMFTAPMAKALVVDDNIVNLFVAKEILNNYEIEVHTASSGAEAIDMVQNNVYDIIFMDYIMPKMDGHETLLEIRNLDGDYFKNVPVIALTAQIVNDSENHYKEEGFQSYVSKPIEIKNIEETLLEFLPKDYICSKSTDLSDLAPVKKEIAINETDWYKDLKSKLVGFDLDKGLQYSNNNYDSYISLLKVIYSDSIGQVDKLRDYLYKSDFNSYKISVHALKSVSASAGELTLSAQCFEHEKAAKIEDAEFINVNFEDLVVNYNEFIAKIKLVIDGDAPSKPINDDLKQASADEIKTLISNLKNYIDDYDLDGAEEVLNQLMSIALDVDTHNDLQSVRDLLAVMKYDKALELLEKY